MQREENGKRWNGVRTGLANDASKKAEEFYRIPCRNLSHTDYRNKTLPSEVSPFRCNQMKSHLNNQFSLAPLLIGLGFTLTGSMGAQTFATLHSFTQGTGFPLVTNSDGAFTQAGVVVSGNTVYGAASYGGNSANGTLFKVNTDGSGFTTMHNFSAFQDPFLVRTNSDGAIPWVGMILSGNTLYGTTGSGGSRGGGTLFKINTDGTGFTVVYNFGFFGEPNGEGFGPQAVLILSGNTLYGTTGIGGSFEPGGGPGTVFKVNTDGTGFTTLHRFNGDDGAFPYGRLLLLGNTLYGTSSQGGEFNTGTLFSLNTDGSGFTNIHSFTALPSVGASTNSDGANPWAGLVQSGTRLYGTTSRGGLSGRGTVFAVNTNGSGFTNIQTFASGNAGARPFGELTISGTTLYGTTTSGGSFGNGTVFALSTVGAGLNTVYSFTGDLGSYPFYTNSDGSSPEGGVALSGNTLYGTAAYSGDSGTGTVFALGLPVAPSVGFTTAGNQLILFWPTNASNFTLQSTTNLSSASWSNVTSGIAVVGTNNMYTNTLNSKSAFFRLKL